MASHKPGSPCCLTVLTEMEQIMYLAVQETNVSMQAIGTRTIHTMDFKAGGIAPFGAILRGKGANKTNRPIGGQKNTEGSKTLNH